MRKFKKTELFYGTWWNSYERANEEYNVSFSFEKFAYWLNFIFMFSMHGLFRKNCFQLKYLLVNIADIFFSRNLPSPPNWEKLNLFAIFSEYCFGKKIMLHKWDSFFFYFLAKATKKIHQFHPKSYWTLLHFGRLNHQVLGEKHALFYTFQIDFVATATQSNNLAVNAKR